MAALCILLALLTGLATATFAQHPAENIAPQALQKDLAFLKDSLRGLHPGLYRYKSKKQIDELFQNARAKLTQPMTLLSYYAVIRYVISGIEDGHTSAFLPGDVNKTMLSQAKLFPLWLHFIGDNAYITAAAGSLPAGTRIDQIDHKVVAKLRNEFFHYIPSDGSNESGKLAEMNYGESPFLYLYYLAYGEKLSFNVHFTRPDGIKGDTIFKAEPFKNILGKPVQQKISRYLTLANTQDSTAVLTVKTFLSGFLDQTGENFKDFVQSSFKELADKHVKKLIIDVRDNAGGNDDNGMLLDSYLVDRPFYYTAKISTTTKVFTAADNTDLLLQQPAADHFKGKVFILMNGKSFSTTADFCAVAQNISHAKFIGEETGGGYYGNTSGARTTLFFPNTHIKVNVPLWAYFDAVQAMKYKDRGVIPDYQVVPTINDILEHRDVQLQFAFKLAHQQ